MAAVLHPLGSGRQIPIDRAVVLVGRSPECDAVLDVSTRISRIHCALVQADSACYIRDLASMNGVWVNGQRVNQECRLTEGASVAIGDVLFQFYEKVPAAGFPAPQVTAPAQSSDPRDPGRHRSFPVLVDKTRRSAEDDVFEVEIRDDDESAPVAASPDRPAAGSQSEIVDVEVLDDADAGDLIRDVDIVQDVEIVEVVEVIDDTEMAGHPAGRDRAELIEGVELIEDVEIVEDPHDEREFPDHPVEFRRRRRRKRSP